MDTTTLILGLGNVLMGDEAIGAHIIRRLETELATSPQLQLIDGGTLGFTLAVPIAACAHLIVVDATRMSATAGTVRVFIDAEMDHYIRKNAKTVHEISLADILDMMRLTDALPLHRALVGIEPDLIGWRDGLSATVIAAIPTAIAQIHALLAHWNAPAAVVHDK